MSGDQWQMFCASINAPKICDCCNRAVRKVRGSMWHGASRICLACFYVWYDPPIAVMDECDPAEIAAVVIAAEAAGTYPFGHNDADYRRIA